MFLKQRFQAKRDVSQLPGYDEQKHNSNVVDESVEKNERGESVVVYRTKKEITDEALRNFVMPVFKR